MAPTILVTGSEGNIGTYVCRSLRETIPGTRIIRVSHSQRPTEADLYVGDLKDPRFVHDLFQKTRPQFVLHLAAQRYSASGFRDAASDLFDNDVSILQNVLRESRAVRKFIYLSSALVYETATSVPFTEDMTESIPPPVSSYGLAKMFGERAVRLFSKQHGIPHTIWRPFNVVSPLEPHDSDGHVFVDFYRRLFVEHVPELEIYGNGAQVRCFTWVEDVAQAIAAYVEDTRTDNQTFNIGGDEPVNLLELADLMLELGHEKGVLPPGYTPAIRSGGTFSGVDSEKRIPSLASIATTLGWKPKTGTRECFSQFIDYKTRA